MHLHPHKTLSTIESRHKPLLVVVDDDPVFRALIKSFASTTYSALEFPDPREVDTILLQSADVLVLGLNMPNIDGVKFIRTLADLSPQPQLLIASGHERRVMRLAQRTAESFGLRNTILLHKPVDRSQFDEAVSLMRSVASKDRPDASFATSIGYEPEEIFGAIKTDEFLPYYQPQIDVNTNSIVGIEALARWNHPSHGVRPPSEFIEIIELSPYATEFTRSMIDLSMRDYMRIKKMTGFNGTLSVNTPCEVIKDSTFTAETIALAEKHKFPLNKLVCEITERGIEDMDASTTATLTRLQMHNIQLAVDDFGTGQSGLSKLKTGAFNEIKIDQAFVTDLTTSANSRFIVEFVLNLAASSGLRVVAEGVEDKATLMLLHEMGCHTVQGYYFTRPVQVTKFVSWFRSWVNDAENGKKK